ncbi:NblA/ycf18 family protein [Lusitaniella coriacea LEGE 07157]|uniref:NblA/ycf18 family protein n=1 Tax=Lusitaniella coriacea LEGE 07157 TaxID=945747 RepID=A0A8J7DW94_9CYAN|nr:NblA/ycf18 family protein [Lusitaniella coriacea]MBE9116316.1 NblA/ycf18 family protein [Lusitaniella coriacea LEGE 07157]
MNPQSFELTLEQQFQIKIIEDSTDKMSREQMQELLVQVSRLLMVKDNVIRNLMKYPSMESLG